MQKTIKSGVARFTLHSCVIQLDPKANAAKDLCARIAIRIPIWVLMRPDKLRA